MTAATCLPGLTNWAKHLFYLVFILVKEHWFVLHLSIHTAISKKKMSKIFLFTVLNESTLMLIIEHMHLQEVERFP